MLEYYLPYHGEYALGVDGRTYAPDTSVMGKAKTLYRNHIPLWVRRPFRDLRDEIQEAAKGPYPQIIDISIQGIHMKFEVPGSQARKLITTIGYEKKYLGLGLSQLKPNDIVWDIGAYLGLWTIPLALKDSSCRIYGFEPDPKSRSVLEKNIKLNNLLPEQATVLPFAISDHNGQSTLFTFNSDLGMPSLRPTSVKNGEIVVPIYSIDGLIDEGIIPQPSIIKIDVEGAEQMIIEGMSYKHRPRELFIEFHPKFLIESYDTTPSELWRKIISLDFTPQAIWLRSNNLLCHFAKK